MSKIIALLLVGLAVGLGNFAAAIAIGLGGINQSIRLRIALIFGIFETGMPIVGLIIGQQLSGKLGAHASLIGGSLLILTGIYVVIMALRKNDESEVKEASLGLGATLLAGLALSVDNLITGFGLGTYHVSLWLAGSVIGVTSVVLALLGLELGNRLSGKVEAYSNVLSGVVLIFVGLAIALKLF